MIIEAKIAALSSLAFLLAFLSPEETGDWTLSTFAVALVIYLLWKSERSERVSELWRRESLEATQDMRRSVDELRHTIEKCLEIDMHREA